MTVLLTLLAWVPISFLSAWFWGTVIARGDDQVECELAPVPNVTAMEPRCELRCHPAPRSLSSMECEV